MRQSIILAGVLVASSVPPPSASAQTTAVVDGAKMATCVQPPIGNQPESTWFATYDVDASQRILVRSLGFFTAAADGTPVRHDIVAAVTNPVWQEVWFLADATIVGDRADRVLTLVSAHDILTRAPADAPTAEQA